MTCGANMPSADTRRRLGDFGESAVAAYLVRQGYTILARKWRCTVGEIDLIACQGDQVIFVEVRTRRGLAQGCAEESITPAKRNRLIQLAYTYLDAQHLDENSAWRIDVVAVQVDAAGRIASLTHIPHAVEL